METRKCQLPESLDFRHYWTPTQLQKNSIKNKFWKTANPKEVDVEFVFSVNSQAIKESEKLEQQRLFSSKEL